MHKEYLNPEGVFKHPAYTRIVTVSGPMKIVFIAGQTPSDGNYDPVAPGNMMAQYRKVVENLDIQLRAAGATWDDIVFKRIFAVDVDGFILAASDPAAPVLWNPHRPPPSTLIGVTRLSKPEFLLEIEVLAIVAAPGSSSAASS